MLPHSDNPPSHTLPKTQGKIDHYSSGKFGVPAKQYVMPVLRIYKGRAEIGKAIPFLTWWSCRTSKKFVLVRETLDCIPFSFFLLFGLKSFVLNYPFVF